MEEERTRARTNAHVRAVSHGRGGGHASTLKRLQAPGHRSRMNGLPFIDSWDHSSLDQNPFEQDMSDIPGTEWPKWVWPEGAAPGKPTRLCQTPAEEEAYLAEFAPAEPSKEDLIAQAEALGIAVDGRWGPDRLKAEIAALQ